MLLKLGHYLARAPIGLSPAYKSPWNMLVSYHFMKEKYSPQSFHASPWFPKS